MKFFKKGIEIKNIEDIENNLSTLAKVKINNRYKKVASRIKIQEAKNKENELDILKIKNENKKKINELQDNLKEQKIKINIKKQETLGKLELKKMENRCDKIDRLEIKGKYFNYFKWSFVLISCFTSMMGFGMMESGFEVVPLLQSIREGKNLNCLIIGIIFLIMQACISLFVSSQEDIRRFFNKGGTNKPLLMLIGIVYIVSFYSNYQFWIAVSSSKFVAMFYSFLIDTTSIFCSVYSDKFLAGDSEEIRKYLSETEEKTKEKKAEKNGATLDTFGVSNGDENGEKTKEKRKRTSNGKNKIKQKEFDEIVRLKFKEGDRIVPKNFNLTDEKDKFRKLCENSDEVEKIGHFWHKKVTEREFGLVGDVGGKNEQ